MNDILNMVIVFIAGLLLGAIFFGGLWLTIRTAVISKKPSLLISGSFILRTGITLVGFYFIGTGNMQRLLLLLSGFITARFLVLHFTKSIDTKQAGKKEVKIET